MEAFSLIFFTLIQAIIDVYTLLVPSFLVRAMLRTGSQKHEGEFSLFLELIEILLRCCKVQTWI